MGMQGNSSFEFGIALTSSRDSITFEKQLARTFRHNTGLAASSPARKANPCMRTSPDVIVERGMTIGVVNALICSSIGSVLELLGRRSVSPVNGGPEPRCCVIWRRRDTILCCTSPEVTGCIWALQRQPLRKSRMLKLGNIFFFFQNALHNRIAARLQI